jgi:hypothetical protein
MNTTQVTYGTAEYIRVHIYRDAPDYMFHYCCEGHNGCSANHREGGPCIAQLEADCDHTVNVLQAAYIIDKILVEVDAYTEEV